MKVLSIAIAVASLSCLGAEDCTMTLYVRDEGGHYGV